MKLNWPKFGRGESKASNVPSAKVQWPMFARQHPKHLSVDDLNKRAEWHREQYQKHKEADNADKAHYHKEEARRADVAAKAASIKTLQFEPRKVPNHLAWPKVARRRIEDLNYRERDERRAWHIKMAIASAIQKQHWKADHHAQNVQDIDDHEQKLKDEKEAKLKKKSK